ncbi:MULTISPECIES: hypothetical protein [unclassified Bradyrhizobium]|uniref:hypothetical protein n=1 Tax=Bradyrhizobium sp. USDA 4541 TaxID=2817704 RepID=UPI0020A3EF12|nr:hypothetical protein [Bradyrhizobium sp. USDA 4541]MCP1848397.1 hypothetical protein [Bradyrhizobium sp. USDA 4541]
MPDWDWYVRKDEITATMSGAADLLGVEIAFVNKDWVLMRSGDPLRREIMRAIWRQERNAKIQVVTTAKPAAITAKIKTPAYSRPRVLRWR